MPMVTCPDGEHHYCTIQSEEACRVCQGYGDAKLQVQDNDATT
jgi:hypothetical protein